MACPGVSGPNLVSACRSGIATAACARAGVVQAVVAGAEGKIRVVGTTTQLTPPQKIEQDVALVFARPSDPLALHNLEDAAGPQLNPISVAHTLGKW